MHISQNTSESSAQNLDRIRLDFTFLWYIVLGLLFFRTKGIRKNGKFRKNFTLQLPMPIIHKGTERIRLNISTLNYTLSFKLLFVELSAASL